MDITKQLWNELESKTPNEEKIHELVTQGADVHGGTGVADICS